MDFIKGCNSKSDSTECETEEIGRREVRQVYLITYSQVDTSKFPTRESFAAAVVASFRSPSANVLHWCCSKGSHKSGGIHYHLSLKLNKSHRWLPAKNYLKEQYNISVHFSSVHANYFTAWKYVTKEDRDFIMSENHPDLWNSAGPLTMKAHLTKAKARRTRKAASLLGDTQGPPNNEETDKETVVRRGTGKKRLRAFDVAEICVSKCIKTRSDLLALAHEQKLEGRTDLAEFVINRSDKIVNTTITTAWEMENAIEEKKRSETSRLDLLRKAGENKCICNIENEWLKSAISLLEKNNISPDHFSHCVR